MSGFVELSHAVADGELGYPGLPVPRVEPYISHAASRDRYEGLAEFEISRIFLVGNSGTYVDSPVHRYPGADDVASIPLERLAALPGICVQARYGTDGRAVVPDGSLAGASGHAVLVHTSWARRRGTDAYWEPGPYLSAELVQVLVAQQVALVGFDASNVDDVGDPRRPAHTALLAVGIPIVEHLTNLDRLPLTGFRFSAVPSPIRGAASFPVRAFAEIADAAD